MRRSSGRKLRFFFSSEHSSLLRQRWGAYPVSTGKLVSLANISDRSWLRATDFQWPKCLPDGEDDVFSRTRCQYDRKSSVLILLGIGGLFNISSDTFRCLMYIAVPLSRPRVLYCPNNISLLALVSAYLPHALSRGSWRNGVLSANLNFRWLEWMIACSMSSLFSDQTNSLARVGCGSSSLTILPSAPLSLLHICLLIARCSSSMVSDLTLEARFVP